MRTIILAIFSVVVILSFVIAFYLGRITSNLDAINQTSKDYQAACVLADICRIMQDNIGLEAQEIYEDYVSNLDTDSTLTITREDLNEYYWCY